MSDTPKDWTGDGNQPPPADVAAEIESGFDLVEGLAEDAKFVSGCQAQQLIKISQLHRLGSMNPLSPAPAAQTSAERARRQLASLSREDLTTKEVAARLYLSDYAARRLVRLALSLTSRFTNTLKALSAGRLDLRRAEIIDEHAGPLAEDRYASALASGESPEQAERWARNIAGMVESLVLGRATTQTPQQLHQAVRRVVNRLDPGFADRRAKKELKCREVTHRTNPIDGTGDVYAHLGAAEAQGVYNVVDAYARAARQAGSDRNLKELRADAFTHLILYGHMPDATSGSSSGNSPGSSSDNNDNPVTVDTENASIVPAVDPNTGDIQRAPTDTNDGESSARPTKDAGTHVDSAVHPRSATGSGRSGLRAHVQVVVGLETLLGMNDDPAHLAGHGSVTAQTARDLAFNAGSTWRRLVTDPVTGYLLNYDRKTYRPPVALADHVRARDLTCRTPNCSRPAAECDLDHIISWPAGATSEQNLATECDRDHRYKHEGKWRHQVSVDPKHPPGTIVMISPTGHVYLSYPHVYTDPVQAPSAPSSTRDADPSLKPSAEQLDSGGGRPTSAHAPPNDPGPPPF